MSLLSELRNSCVCPILAGKKGPRKFDVEAMFEKTRRTAREMMGSKASLETSQGYLRFLLRCSYEFCR